MNAGVPAKRGKQYSTEFWTKALQTVGKSYFPRKYGSTEDAQSVQLALEAGFAMLLANQKRRTHHKDTSKHMGARLLFWGRGYRDEVTMITLAASGPKWKKLARILMHVCTNAWRTRGVSHRWECYGESVI